MDQKGLGILCLAGWHARVELDGGKCESLKLDANIVKLLSVSTFCMHVCVSAHKHVCLKRSQVSTGSPWSWSYRQL